MVILCFTFIQQYTLYSFKLLKLGYFIFKEICRSYSICNVCVKVGIHGIKNWHVLANSIGAEMQTCSALRLQCMQRFKGTITSVSLYMLYHIITICNQLSINACWIALQRFFSYRNISTCKETKFLFIY